MKKRAIIIGAGPAGLTAAYELLKRTDIQPIVLERSGDIGGISKTVNHKGNRIDIGGHRFFSKSDRVMNWWMDIMPVQTDATAPFKITYQQRSRSMNPADQPPPSNTTADQTDKVMLVRKRLSRIYFMRKFFTYPIQLSIDTLRRLGLIRTIAILFSYLKAQLFPRRQERNLEDFMVNRFGYTLYNLFFKDYTEKVWGIPCDKISAEWGAQRIKGVSVSKAIQHAIQSALQKKQNEDIAQKDTETSLIEQFLYPKLGPGQLWEEVARQVEDMGGKILMQHDVKRIYTEDNKVTAVAAINHITGETSYLEGDYFFSTMPVQELIGGLDGPIPEEVKQVASGLQYRDFITVGILLKRLSQLDKQTGEWKPLELKDTWIYIQEKDVKVGRLQLFNNWSPYMVKDPDTVWVGMEFFCDQMDDFWKMPDIEIQRLAIRELEKIGLASAANVLDATVLRMEKTYPAYFGTYDRFDVIRGYVDNFKNLFLVGRNGMHKYNNSDHSMLTAMVAVDNICAGVVSKENIWAINTEQEYHEEKGTVQQMDEPKRETAVMQQAGSFSLKDYIFKHPAYKWYAYIGILGTIVQWVIFKFLYPYASFINGDSYAYIETALNNMSINTYPVGYSMFLRLFSVFTKSDTALVTFQYLMLQASIMGFLFTVFHFYKPSRIVKILSFGFLLFNPIFLYVANYVSSDALFISLSLIWFSLLIWTTYQPSRRLVIWHALALFIAFTVRYNALYYPIIAGVGFLLSKQKALLKLAGLGLVILLLGSFIQYTSNQYFSLTGKRQFSPFTGWQMANNAMYAYRKVDSAHLKPVPAKFRSLDKAVRNYFDSTRDTRKYPYELMKISTVYMWSSFSPLNYYMNKQFEKDTTKNVLKRWASVAPLYADYGAYLMRQYPMTFAKHYLWPNALKYYTPPLEFLESYNTGTDTIYPIGRVWFGYNSTNVKSYFKELRVKALDSYSILAAAVNVIFLFSLLSFMLLQGYQQRPVLLKGLILVAGLWLSNFGFSVFAAPIALRFQLFPLIILVPFSLLQLEFVVRMAKAQEISRQPKEGTALQMAG